MSGYRGFIVGMSCVLTMLPALTAAQTSAIGLPVAVGQKVWITSADGRVTKGKVRKLTPDTVEIGEDGVATTHLAVADVRRIQVPDSVRNGVVKGALILGLVGTLLGGAAGLAADTTELLGGDTDADNVDKGVDGGFIGGVVAGALLGWALDAAKVKTVYQREAGGMSVGVRPIVSAAGKGLGVQVRW